MSETIAHTAPLERWSGERGTYHLVTIKGEAAEAITVHEKLHRLEFGKRRGFGSVKVMARIGVTEWKTSVFPSTPSSPSPPSDDSDDASEWWLLVGAKVRKAEDIQEGDQVRLELEPI